MIDVRWNGGEDPGTELARLSEEARAPGVIRIAFDGGGSGEALSWERLESWTRSRAVTVAEIRGGLSSPAMEVALCCDLVCARPGAQLDLPAVGRVPSAPLLWAAGRAGKRALARVLLHGEPIRLDEAADIGLVHVVLAAEDPLPPAEGVSVAALTAARDLLRARADRGGGLALEMATFRFLFAVGDPREGARAFLERRPPRF
ncbi:MAG: hypothetical protein LJE95_01135 [Acidobacteria bacterium]|nr:hypothetical protein [Acidobacteriota bacterium]